MRWPPLSTSVLAEDAGAIVLTAEPPVFCAGGSLDGLLARDVPLDHLYRGFLALAAAPVPTIAAVGGPAIGAGVNLPLACDVIVDVGPGPVRPPLPRCRHSPRRRNTCGACSQPDREPGRSRHGAVRRRPRRPGRGDRRLGLAVRGPG